MSQHNQTQTTDPVAEFLAKGGRIQSVDAGVRTMSEREVYGKSSGSDEVAARFTKADNDYTEQRMRDAENQVGLDQHHAYYRW